MELARRIASRPALLISGVLVVGILAILGILSFNPSDKSATTGPGPVATAGANGGAPTPVPSSRALIFLPTPTPVPTPTAMRGLKEGIIQIGVDSPISGADAKNGIPTRNGVQLAIEQTNAKEV